MPYSNTAYCQRCQCHTALHLNASGASTIQQYSLLPAVPVPHQILISSLALLMAYTVIHFHGCRERAWTCCRADRLQIFTLNRKRFVAWAWAGRVSLYSRQIWYTCNTVGPVICTGFTAPPPISIETHQGRCRWAGRPSRTNRYCFLPCTII